MLSCLWNDFNLLLNNMNTATEKSIDSVALLGSMDDGAIIISQVQHKKLSANVNKLSTNDGLAVREPESYELQVQENTTDLKTYK